MTPATTTQNLLLWGAALGLAVLLSFLSGVATHWPEGGAIDWRGVALDVIQTILTTAPLVAAGFGLPRIGKEPIAALVSQVGPGPAQAALENEATRQETGVGTALRPITQDLVTALADHLHGDVIDALEARMRMSPSSLEGDDPVASGPPPPPPPAPGTDFYRDMRTV